MKYFLFACLFFTLALPAEAGPLRDRIKDRIAERQTVKPAPSGTDIAIFGLSYGGDKAQAYDLYAKKGTQNAPIIVMVHGGGWKHGDKAMPRMVENKMKYWTGKGYVFVSMNYRMLPEVKPDVQAQDVAKAIATLQEQAVQYGGDPERIVVMGHSAGGHLVALLSANPALAAAQGAKPWRATVVLDAGALDVASIMSRKHMFIYDEPFGTDPDYWKKVSPIENITPQALPMLLVCALKRPDDSCGQSHKFAAKLGADTPVLEEELDHRGVNENLGLPGDYTAAVDAFISQRLN